jgi:hypothetical protein
MNIVAVAWTGEETVARGDELDPDVMVIALISTGKAVSLSRRGLWVAAGSTRGE